MYKIKKIVLGFIFVFASVLFISGVSAAEEYTTLTYGGSEYRITRESLGPSFYSNIRSTYVSGALKTEGQAGRHTGLFWVDSGRLEVSFASANQYLLKNWTARGTYNTRMTWKNITSGSTFRGYVDLYD